ncbi:hypothetical protein J5N97_026745 [Dioscorea zingiberensis]|uniref:At1g61320/AtMIF1 LRR domain-containing protein n=1 Tax=Dioscorea zingiberensis TaxID=325984 RepID=A0A9D5C435_9LILI|nr:hypothetical protein J5N97_026745 [Dioscorea zingiberensis]
MAASSSHSSSRTVVLSDIPFTKPDDCRQLILDGRQALANGIKLSGQKSFVDHAYTVLMPYQHTGINSFGLRFSDPGEFISHVNEWVHIAARGRSLLELDLDFSDVSLHDKFPEGNKACGDLVPNVYIMCGSLDSLSLAGCRFDASRFDAFPSLRAVSIARITLEEAKLDQLIEKCISLEDLSLIRLSSVDSINIDDKKGMLKRLIIEHCHSEGTGFVHIHAPNLRYFNYVGDFKIFTMDAPKVEEAVLDFSLEDTFRGDEGYLISGVISHFVTARTITVCSYTTQVIAHNEDPLRLPASNQMLRHLILKKVSIHQNELPGIALLLRSYPELETLTIEIGDTKHIEDYDYPYDHRPLNGDAFWASQITAIPCLRRHLKTIEVQDFKGTVNELAFLKFLLKKSNVLQDVILEVAKEGSIETRNRYMGLAQTLHGLNNASPDVTLTIR